MKRITLLPTGGTAAVTTGSPLLAALRAKQVPVLASCGGKGICSTCHVRVTRGMADLSPVGERERRTLSLVADTGPDSRLACQAVVYGDDIEVRIPEGLYIERADDLLALLGSPAAQNILHPITGAVLIPKGKRITRSMLEQSRHVDAEVRQLRDGATDAPPAPSRTGFLASGVAFRPPPSRQLLSDTTFHQPGGSVFETKTALGAVTTPPARAAAAKTGPITAPQSRTEPILPAAPRVNPRDVHPGEQVDHYLLLECVGKGGAGVVYRALNTRLKTLVAIKFLRTDTRSPDSLARLAREAQMLAQLAHPNVVRLLDFNDDPSRPYAVMEFIDGLSLADLIQQSGRLSRTRAVQLALDIVAGLEAARQAGIVHRDVKPDNVLVARTGGARLMDFGLAVVQKSPAAAQVKCEGTIGYMSPEQARGSGAVDHRSDIYSLGVTLYQMVTGRLPYAGENALEIMVQHVEAPIPLAHEAVSTVPPEVSEVIRHMMAKNPDNRFQDYPQLRAAFQQLLPTPQASGPLVSQA